VVADVGSGEAAFTINRTVTTRRFAEIAAVRQKRKSEQSEGNEIALDITVNGGFLLEGAEPPADAAGRCWIGDKLYRISGLVKTAATGQKYYSLTFQLDDFQLDTIKQEIENRQAGK
jgi:hypothetical protein